MNPKPLTFGTLILAIMTVCIAITEDKIPREIATGTVVLQCMAIASTKKKNVDLRA